MSGPSYTQTYNSASSNDEAALNNETGHAADGSLTFPETLSTEFRHIIHLQRYEYSRTDLKSTPTTKKSGKLITLPVPEELSANYGASWENKSLGIMGNKARNLASSVMSDVERTGSVSDAVKSKLGSGSQIFSTLKSLAVGAGIDAAAGSDIGDIILSGAGLARNPYQAVLYEAPELRSFQFEWKMIAANEEESTIIRDIIKEFKLGMHPEFDPKMENNLFKYPDIWVIEFPNPDYLFKMTNCVLTECEVDYHSEGTPTYFRIENESIPVSIKVGAKFQEVTILTRDDITAGY